MGKESSGDGPGEYPSPTAHPIRLAARRLEDAPRTPRAAWQMFRVWCLGWPPSPNLNICHRRPDASVSEGHSPAVLGRPLPDSELRIRLSRRLFRRGRASCRPETDRFAIYSQSV